jgi:hypothetical protein
MIMTKREPLIQHLDFDMVIDGPKTAVEKLFGIHHTRYILRSPIVYYSRRYGKWLTCPIGMDSDGASGPAMDITSQGWWCHDWACGHKRWDDGSYITPLQRSMILHDILRAEGRQIRAKTWMPVVWFWSAITNNGVKR